MIKRTRALLLVFPLIFCLFLTSCNTMDVYSEADQQYLVCSIGFERIGGEIKCFAESITVNTESTEQSAERKIFSATGNNAEESVLNLAGKLSKPLLFDHCGLIAVDQNLTAEQFESVIDYCAQNEQLNLAAYVVSTEMPQKLFECSPVSTLSIGYDLMGVIERVQALTGVTFHSRYYEICALRLKIGKCFLLPEISVQENEYILSGGNIYDNNISLKRLDITECSLYSILGGSFTDGSVESIKIESLKTYYNFSLENEVLHIKLDIKTDISNEQKTFLKEMLSKNVYELKKTQSDVLGFAERIYRKDSRLWNKIKKNYQIYLKTAEIEVKL